MSGSIKEKIAEIIKNTGADGCVECGKCVAVCPMSEMYPDFGWEMSPRGMIRRTVMGGGYPPGSDDLALHRVQCRYRRLPGRGKLPGSGAKSSSAGG